MQKVLNVNQRLVFGRLQKCGLVHYGNVTTDKAAAAIRAEYKAFAASCPSNKVVLRSRNYGEYPVTVIDGIWEAAKPHEVAAYERRKAAAAKKVATTKRYLEVRRTRRIKSLLKEATALGLRVVDANGLSVKA